MSRILLFLVLVLTGCPADTPPVTTSDAGRDMCRDCTDGPKLPNSFIRDDAGGDRGELVSVRIDPETAELVSVDGDTPVQHFRLIGVFEDGSEEIVPAAFEIDNPALGAFDTANGELISNGIVGGVATVTATALEGSLSPQIADVTVRIERLILSRDAPRDPSVVFKDQQSDPEFAANIVYPLEGAVLPQNAFPIDIQWENGLGSDFFKVTLSKPNANIVSVFKHTGSNFNNHWVVDEDAWRSIAQTDPDDDATIEIERWVALNQNVYTSPPVRIRFARAALSGSIYYWDISEGAIIRINDGSGVGEAFLPTPPADSNGNRCVGCHSLSNNGQYMVGRLGTGDNIGAVFDVTTDLTTTPAPTVWPVDVNNGERWWASTWNPSDDRLLVTRTEPTGGMDLIDPFTGAVVPVAQGSLPTSNVTQPAWAPDDSLVAYISNIDSWGGDMTTGDLTVLPVTGRDSFGAPQTLVSGSIPGAMPAGTSSSYPTWTPDSQYIAFAHGTGARSDRDESAIYMMQRDGSNVVRLDNACGGDRTDNFQPNFSAFDSGGYYWMMFLSRRDYGNAAAGTQGANRQQLWVSAIRKDAAPGEDPSSVPYWLAGQRTQSMNISGFWAPRPCREDGESCSVGSECCGGSCARDPDGALVCSPPPPELCRELNETCSSTADCCVEDPELVCSNNVCQRVVN